MSRIFTVNGKDVDIDDTDAVQALTNQEFTELFTLVKNTASIDDEHTVPPILTEREPGTGFIIAMPHASPASDEAEQS